MFQVVIKGANLKALTKACDDLHAQLHAGNVSVKEEASVEVTVDKTPQAEAPAPVVAQPEPTPAPATQAAPQVDGDLDAEGLPWDKRIHSSSKKKKADGTWVKRKGVDAAEFLRIKSELAQAKNTPSVAIPAAPTGPAVQPQYEEPAPAPAPVVAQPEPTPAPAAMPTTPPQPMMNTGHTQETFNANLPMVISTLITEGKIDQGYVNQLKEYFGVQEIWQVNDQQKVEMFNTFVAGGLIQKV